MSKVKSLADLKRVREEALKKQEAKNTASRIQIVIGMGTVGIVAGARETLKAILDFIAKEDLQDIAVRQTSNIGMDSWEPIVQVIVDDEPGVSYGKVTAEVARKIMKEHVIDGNIVKEYVIEIQ
ncbi:MAG: (2Fe-2S) ferredoxin domain-containing protein [Anaerolineaceae bacterium]|jgi:(2Fe-2S) ferredoxin|nr:(2Fe-2S) ferredoxin domain-containing protein [Anaerolineaceae bacterium]